MRKIIILLLAMVGSYYVQGQMSYLLSYPVSFPLGDLHNYSSNVSFRGINVEYDKKMQPKTAADIEIGWNIFYQHVNQKTYTEGTASISGVQYRYTNAVPIIAGGKYYPATANKAIKPYVGLGFGTLYANRRTDFGLYRIVSEAWQFCIRPEAGLEFKMGYGVSLFIGAKYYWAFDAGELGGQPYLSVNLGIRMSMY